MTLSVGVTFKLHSLDAFLFARLMTPLSVAFFFAKRRRENEIPHSGNSGYRHTRFTLRWGLSPLQFSA